MAAQIRDYADQLAAALANTVTTNINGAPVDEPQNIIRTMRISSGLGARVYLVGNGGSASIASHIAIDFNKVCQIRAVPLTDVSALTCLSNDYAYEEVFAEQIGFYGEPKDSLIAISSSGKSPNIVRAAAKAHEKGMLVVTLTGFRFDNPLRALGNYNFWVPSSSYGIVEVSHTAILHSLVDRMAAELQEDR